MDIAVRCVRAFAPVVARLSIVAALIFSTTHVSAQMAMPAQFDVAPSGAATLNVPIGVPPGIAGVEPRLALTYNSQSPSGLLGTGWELAGLSAITRCAQTKLDDNQRGMINFDSADRFCLDGQRLVLVPATGAYGAANTEYRTVMESFSKVQASADASASPPLTSGPAYFTVKTKAGLTMEYGRTADSRIFGKNMLVNSESVVAIWALNKVTDIKGNYLTVAYTNDAANGQYYPTVIRYTGNDTTGQTPHNTINFSYESRSDVVASYGAGRMFKRTVRLSKINTATRDAAGSAVAVNEYRLAYLGDAKQSRLQTVRVCDPAGACMPPVTANWSGYGSTTFQPMYAAPVSFGMASNQWVGDFNGDGRQDAMAMVNGAIQAFLSNGDGTFQASYWSVPSGMVWNAYGYVWAGDFDGDGKADIASLQGSNLYVLWSVGNGFSLGIYPVPASAWGSPAYTWIGDFDGDGIADIASASGNGVFMHRFQPNRAAPVSQTWAVSNGTGTPWGQAAYTHSGDFNGDGKTDLITMVEQGGGVLRLHQYTSTGTAFTFTPSTWTLPANYGNSLHKIIPGDFNGDGKTDLSVVEENRIATGDGHTIGHAVYVVLSTGKGFDSSQWQPIKTGYVNDNQMVGEWWDFMYWDLTLSWVGDIDGDGKSDLVRYTVSEPSQLHTYISNGATFVQTNQTPYGVPYMKPNAAFADFMGGGRASFLALESSNYIPETYYYQATAGDTITSVSSGLGGHLPGIPGNIALTYKMLPQAGSTYSNQGITVTYPAVQTTPPIRVVSQVANADGVGGTRSKSFKYGPAVLERGTGRELLGFQWWQTTDDKTGMVSRTYFRQDHPFTGQINHQGTGTSESDWSNLSLTTNWFSCFDPAVGATTNCTAGAGKRYFVFSAVTDSQGKDLNGAVLPRVQTCQMYDVNGNVSSIVVDTLNTDGTPAGFSKKTVNTYKDDLTKWHLGRLVKSQVTAKTGTDAPQRCGITPGQVPSTTLTTESAAPTVRPLSVRPSRL